MERERRIEILTQISDSGTACDATEDEITLLRVLGLISPAPITIGMSESGKLPHLPAKGRYSITGKGCADIKGDDGETTNP